MSDHQAATGTHAHSGDCHEHEGKHCDQKHGAVRIMGI